MTQTPPYNDQFPTDPRHLLIAVAVCTALALTLPTEQVQSFTGLLALVIPLLQGRR